MQSRVRMTLEISSELNDKLNQLAAEAGGSKSDFLRKAIALAEAAVDARKTGCQVAIVDRNRKVVTTFVGL